MPTYEYKCEKCGHSEDKVHRMSESPEFSCPECNSPMKKQLSLNVSGFIIRGGTEASHWSEKRKRMKRSEELAIRQEKHKAEMPKIQPNIAGVKVDSWSDAQKMAKEAGLNHESYTPFVEKEKKNKLVVPSGNITA